MKSSLETACGRESGYNKNRLKLLCAGLIRLGSDGLPLIAGLTLARTHLANYSVTSFRMRRSGNQLPASGISIVRPGHSHPVHCHAGGH
jgi:hypothetical protein